MSDGNHDCTIDQDVHFMDLGGHCYMVPCHENLKMTKFVDEVWSPNMPKDANIQCGALSFGLQLSEFAKANYSKYEVTREEYEKRSV